MQWSRIPVSVCVRVSLQCTREGNSSDVLERAEFSNVVNVLGYFWCVVFGVCCFCVFGSPLLLQG